MIYPILIFLIIVADQYSKWYMSDLLALCIPGQCHSVEILPVFQFTLLHNYGAAFSFLDVAGGGQRIFLVAISAIVSAGLLVWLYKIWRTEKLLAYGLATVSGGAIGNLIDRAADGFVVDFIVVHWQNHYFPAFNIADSAISIGAGLLILDMILQAKREAQQKEV